jgi:uncharacterized membrane protein
MELQTPSAAGEPRLRLSGLDALRGTVMIVMALDHVRDFFHRDAALYQPTDLTRTTAFLFFTRWITHFCMPVFMFCAGAGAYLWWQRGGRGPARPKRELATFLATRGIWFLLLELTVMQFAYDFNFSPENVVLLLVLYIFGACMLLMSGLVYLPMRWLAIVSVAIIALHNLLDPVKAGQFGHTAWIWDLLHQPGFFMAMGQGVVVVYPLLPWIGVMAGGFCFGQVLTMEASERRRWMRILGSGMIVLFLLLRTINVYGDPSRWAVQKSAAFTVLSFLNCTKYPASLDYVLMTIGPALLLLSWYESRSFAEGNPLIVFGRVPLFYFILHFYAIHLLLVVFACVQYGSGALHFIFHPPPALGGSAEVYPPSFGYPLWVTYAVWMGLVIALYPLCRWYAGVKTRSRSRWLSYL